MTGAAPEAAAAGEAGAGAEASGGCCGGASGGGCAAAALRSACSTAGDGTPVVRWLVADSIWWGGRLRKGVALRIAENGAIKPVPAELAPLAGTRRFPGTLLPALVDAHVHSALVDLTTVRAGGIGSVWDLGGVPTDVQDLAARARQPGSPLPRIRYAGPFLIAPGGYPSDRPWAPAGSWREITSPADAALAVAEAQSSGAGLIKVTAHAGGPMLPPETMRALVEAAHASGLEVVVHAEGAGTVAAALAAGADMLAHTPWSELLGDTLVRDCAARMRWISTLDIHGWGDPDPAREIAVVNLRRFIEYGGSVRYGTDLGNGPLPAGINVREIRALQEAGLDPNAVLSAMTENDSRELSWVPDGLTLEPEGFPDSLATARVLDDSVRPR